MEVDAREGERERKESEREMCLKLFKGDRDI